MVELLDINVWNIIFDYLESCDKLNLVKSSQQFNDLNKLIVHFTLTCENINDVMTNCPYVTSLQCCRENIDIIGLTNLTTLNCSYCMRVKLKNLPNLT